MIIYRVFKKHNDYFNDFAIIVILVQLCKIIVFFYIAHYVILIISNSDYVIS